MPPAARLGDITTHGDPLGPFGGSFNVLIGGRPAWRAIIDLHTCPIADGPKPHAGGPVMEGSRTVFINNFPAARMFDEIVEVGVPNYIVLGSFNVIIGR